jgi:hypothetical protein
VIPKVLDRGFLKQVRVPKSKPDFEAIPLEFKSSSGKPILNDSLDLQSLDGVTTSLFQAEVVLEPSQEYMLSLRARVYTEATAPLLMDIYQATEYHDQEPTLSVSPYLLTKKYRIYSKRLTTTENSKKKVFIRVYTNSVSPILVNSISLSKVQPLDPTKYIKPYRKILQTKEEVLYENTLSLPRIYSISRLETTRSLQDFKWNVYRDVPDVFKIGYVSNNDIREIGSSSFKRGEIKLELYSNSEVRFQTKFSNRGFVILSDFFYDGWDAYIGTNMVRIYRVNGLARGIVVPNGTQTIRFVYRPKYLFWTVTVSITTLLGSLFLVSYKRN